MNPEEDRIQVASADTVMEFQRQLNYFYAKGYHLLTQSTAPLGDKIIFTAVLERDDTRFSAAPPGVAAPFFEEFPDEF